MQFLERLIGVVAPHDCVGCGSEGQLLCSDCEAKKLIFMPSFCYFCKQPTLKSTICAHCAPNSKLDAVHIGALYEGVARELVNRLKFQRAIGAGTTMGRIMAKGLPVLPDNVIVVHVPTATDRIRQRGYDQAKLLARSIAHIRKLRHYSVLSKVNQLRQVGSDRSERHAQSAVSFRITRPRLVNGKHVLLVDDVLTTGASLEACALLLRQHGAQSVTAAVFAHKL